MMIRPAEGTLLEDFVERHPPCSLPRYGRAENAIPKSRFCRRPELVRASSSDLSI